MSSELQLIGGGAIWWTLTR